MFHIYQCHSKLDNLFFSYKSFPYTTQLLPSIYQLHRKYYNFLNLYNLDKFEKKNHCYHYWKEYYCSIH